MNPLTIFFIVLVIVLLAIGFYFIFKDDENPTPGPTPGPSEDDTYIDPGVTGRYVKLIHTVAYNANRPGGDEGKHANINFAELEVFDIDGNNLSLAKTVTGSSFRGAAAGWKLVDGDFTNFAQTVSRDESEKDYMMVDLGLSTIKKIKITNRSADDRKIQGVKLLIIDDDGNTIRQETPVITTVAGTYTITFPENVWTTS